MSQAQTEAIAKAIDRCLFAAQMAADAAKVRLALLFL